MELTYENLLNTLTVASSADRSVEQSNAEAQVKKWEILPGFHYFLQEVYLNTAIGLQIRWLAIICFKNGIDKYWRSSKQHAISKEEKAQIKSRVFYLLHEKNNQLAVQNAHAIARIARFDFPVEWPLIFDEISKNLQDSVFERNDLVCTNNLLIILNKVVKAISAVRIGRARQAMQAKAPIVLSILIKLYLKFFQIWTVSLDLTTMELCYSCLKNLKRLIPDGFENPHKNQEISDFINLSVDHLQGLISEHEKYSSDLIERYVKCYTKLYLNMITINPTSFLLLSCSQRLISTFLFILELKSGLIYNSNEENDFWEVLALKDFMILKKVITYIYKKGAVTLKLKNEKTEINNVINKLTSETFTPDAILHLCDFIITWYLRLRPADLEGWLIEPEEWSNEDDLSSWEYQIRPCAENFYQDLITYFPDIVIPFVADKISKGLMQNDSVDNILTKDSILCTFQLSSAALGNSVNFDQLLNDVFIPEGLKNDLTENKILKRRICLIINEWVGVQCSKESRVLIYKLLTDFLNPENQMNDIVVKLAAVQSLKVVIEDWDFNKTDFKPYLNNFVKLLISLLNNLSLVESKLNIFKTLSVIIERSNPMIDAISLNDTITVVQQNLNHNTEPIVKSALLRVLKSLVISLNEESPRVYTLALPLIENSCSEGSSEFALLSEDGFDLWLSVLQYCPEKSEGVINLFKLILNGLMNCTEILPTILGIVRSYALIDCNIFTGELGLEVFKVLGGYLNGMRDDSFAVFIGFMDILLVSLSMNEQLVGVLVQSGLMEAMIKYVLDEDKSVVLGNKIFLLFSRLGEASAETFLNILGHIGCGEEIFKIWLEHYEGNGAPRNKKINLVGLLSISGYGAGKGVLKETFGLVLHKSFLFLEEVNEDGDVYREGGVYEDIDDYMYIDENIRPHGEKLRYEKVLSQDKIFKKRLKQVIKDTVQTVQEAHGSVLDELVRSGDSYVIEKLQLL